MALCVPPGGVGAVPPAGRVRRDDMMRAMEIGARGARMGVARAA
jgi:hypothetical protein